MPIDHWMMFGTFAEQRHFLYPTPESYKGVVINANMAAHAPDGLAVFLLQNTNLVYFIDPMTHAFQHNPSFVLNDEGEAKSSIQALALHYDPKAAHLYQLVGKKPLLPSHLTDEVLENIVENCLQFQRRTLVEAMKQADTFKYVDFAQLNLAPYALVAPYFYLTETNYESWLPLQIRCCKIGSELAKGDRFYSGVLLSRGLLADSRKRKNIVDAMLATDAVGFILWIDEFDEQQAGENDLRAFLDLSRSLRDENKRDVINLHGGYFSILCAGNLGDGALTGVTHAPEFGEFRPVVPVGGGIPMARYYIPQLHARVRYRDAVRLFRMLGWLKDAKAFHENVCSCPVCEDTLQGDAANFVLFGRGNIREVRRGTGVVRIDFPTAETKKRCLQHYLQRKSLEFRFSADASREKLLDDLQQGVSLYQDYLGDGISYLDSWRQAFNG